MFYFRVFNLHPWDPLSDTETNNEIAQKQKICPKAVINIYISIAFPGNGLKGGIEDFCF